jgi:PAS domain S-box-containing protein
MALIGTLLSAARLVGHVSGFNLGLDNVRLPLLASGSPAVMSPATALAMTLLGIALLLADRSSSGVRRQWPGLAGLVIAWLGICLHVLGGRQLPSFAAMSPVTALSLLILCVGVLCARPEGGVIGPLQADTPGAAMARGLIPAAFVVPLVVGWLRLQAQHAGWVDTGSGLALFALVNTLIFATLAWLGARRIDLADAARRQAVAQALAGQRMLQTVIDNSGAVIYAKDVDGRYLLVNRLYTELFHLRPEDVIGKTDRDLFDVAAAQAFQAMDRRALVAGHALVEEETAPLDDGPHTYLSVKCPLHDTEDRVIGVIGVSTDITDRRRAQLRLEAQLERLRLLDQITRSIGEHQDLQSVYQVAIRSLEDRLPLDFCCICRYDAVDDALQVIRVGAKSEALALSLSLDENATIPIDRNGLSRCVRGELVYEPDIRSLPFAFPQRLSQGQLGSLVVAPLRSESRVFGVLVAARLPVDAFSSSDCEFLGQLSAHVALAARQAELYRALQRAYDDLRLTQQSLLQQERLRALGQLASGIAHDINNAISPVVLYTESLLEREGGLTERGRSQLQTIARAVDDVAATVARMREFYRRNDADAPLHPVRVNDLLHEVLELTRVRWQDMPQQRGVVIHAAVDTADDLPAVPGTESELREALTNLIFNAVDAMPDGGSLTLRTRLHTELALPVQVEVVDTGVGMDEDTRGRCLEPFFTTKGERGTGLGLAMVYGVLQRHGATIDIQSQLAQGTTVRISFPMWAGLDDHDASPARAALPVPHLHILLVDDDPVVLKSLSDMLEQDGHAVTATSGGQPGIAALHAARQAGTPFDLVITDLGMPYVDGRRVAAAVKLIDASTPVLMLTGWGRRLADDGDIPEHVDLMLAKPAGLQALRAALVQLSSLGAQPGTTARTSS